MRNSILYPRRNRAIQGGIVAVGLCAFLAGAALLRAPAAGWSSKEHVGIQLSLKGLENYDSERGSVFWMDQQSGRVTVIGRYDSGMGSGDMEIRIPTYVVNAGTPVSGLLWPSRARSYIPHMNFLFDADLRKRLDLKMAVIRDNQAVQEKADRTGRILVTLLSERIEPEIANLAADPEFRAAIIRTGIDVAIIKLPDIINKIRPNEPAPSDQQDFGQLANGDMDWSEILDVARRHLSAWDWKQWSQDIQHDPKFNEALDALVVELEPHLKNALDEILWFQPGQYGAEIPNARLIWVAKRMLLGGRSSDILLYEDPAGLPLKNNGTIFCKVAR